MINRAAPFRGRSRTRSPSGAAPFNQLGRLLRGPSPWRPTYGRATRWLLVVLFGTISLMGAGCGVTTRETSSPSTPVTSTGPPTTSPTATTIPVQLPISEPGSAPVSVLFTIPVGEGGVTYEGGEPDWLLTGPAGFSVAADVSVWIADTQGLRLLRVGADGSILVDVDTDADEVGPLIDVVAHDGGVWGLEAVPVLDRYRLVSYSNTGNYLGAHTLPDGLHLENGLTGIEMGPNGDLWVELEAGTMVYAAFDEGGRFSPRLLPGYQIDGLTLRPLATTERLARFAIGEATLEIPIREQGSLTYEGTVPGAVAVLLSDVWLDDGVLAVDLTVLYVDLAGRVLATATYPLPEVAANAYVPQDFISVAPDGRLIAVVPRPDRIDVVSLNLHEAAPEEDSR